MPARANIAINDGESSPVTHTFVPDGDVGPNHARFINANASVPAASEFLFVGVTRSSAKAEDYSRPGKKVPPSKGWVRLLYPATYTEAVSGLVLVDYVDEHWYQHYVHPRSSTQRRKNGRMIIYNALAATLIGPNTLDAGTGIY